MLYRLAGLAWILLSASAAAQSARTLEAVRLHRPEALSLAREELLNCPAKSCPQRGRLSLLVGTLALSEGHWDEARELLSTSQLTGPLVPFVQFYLGQALFYSGDDAGAAKAFGRALETGPLALSVRARARRGETLLHAGKSKQALPDLEQSVTDKGGPELLFFRAQARRAEGLAKGETDDLRAIVLQFPLHPYAEPALLRLVGLKQTLTFEERLQRARALLNGGEGARAQEELNTAQPLAKSAGQKDSLTLVQSLVFLNAGRTAEAEAGFKKLQQGTGGLAAEASLILARRALKINDNESARLQMEALQKRFPREWAAEEAGFYIGWLELQSGHFAEAAAAFTRFGQKYPRSRKRDEALWFSALAQLRLDQPALAKAALQQLMTGYPRSSLLHQARYWSARAGQLAGDPPEQVAAGFTSCITLSPGTFYALLASERLREMGQVPPPAFPEPPRLMEVARPPELEGALALGEVGLFQDAADEIQARIAKVRTPEQALPFAQALIQVQEYGPAHTLAARTLWGKAYGGRVPEALAAFYPRAFEDAVLSESARFKVDPYLVWAIMRRESAFRPGVLSAADARGLMQVIPRTGKAIAAQLEEAVPVPDDLFSPSRSIRYGSWYLAQLMQRFGHPVMAAAAYNAGPSAAVRWTQQKGALPLDLFVEEIPYKETRAYVKQVVADLYLYQSFYKGPTAASRLVMTVPVPAAQGVNF